MRTIKLTKRMVKTLSITSSSVEQTIELGRLIGGELKEGNVVALVGQLGSGKTYLTKGIAEGLGVRDKRVIKSPSFVLINEYHGRVPVYHIDAYRLRDSVDMFTLGSDEIFWGNGVSIIEWADRVASSLPAEYLKITLSIISPSVRRIEICAYGKRYECIVERLNQRQYKFV
ncbi:MAG TPA: tRNA (adenosine(37)-N6)-threonylcarbamoyltransferase complex ATPase subunit type 1 TsaE [Candidatus Brocadiia bacterium]